MNKIILSFVLSVLVLLSGCTTTTVRNDYPGHCDGVLPGINCNSNGIDNYMSNVSYVLRP